MTANDLPTIGPDLEYCHRVVEDVSRTFALTIDLLEPPLADHICVGYLLCRVADTIEDANRLSAPEQVALLRSYDAALDPTDETTIREFGDDLASRLPRESMADEERTADWAVARDAATVVATFDSFDRETRMAVRPPVREMVRGMAIFIERYEETDGLRIRTGAELERYCHYVAGTVGRLVTNLLTNRELSASREHTLRRTAGDFGRLLQLVNVAKDVHDDYRTENNVYLPARWLDAEGVSQDAVLAERNRQAVARVVARVTKRARSHRTAAREYVEAMPLRGGNTLAAWAVPYLLAVGTLRELERNPVAAVRDEPVKVSREEVGAIVNAVVNHGRADVPEIRRTVSRTPYHRAVARKES
jgi:farnesyl-diphosphate farnesyltransferase